MKTHTIDFREFVRNEQLPKPCPKDIVTHSVFTTGYIIIGITSLVGFVAAFSENYAARKGDQFKAQNIVAIMKVIIAITSILALVYFLLNNPMLKWV